VSVDAGILAILVPLILLQLILLVLAIVDITKPERRVRGGNKIVWVLVIVLIQMIGPLLYFLVGREES
jgi:hypothetical protein